MIIGIAGHKGAGKSTVAEILRRRYGFTMRALADPLKAACREVFGWTHEHTDGALKEEPTPYGITPRQAMQHLGTEWGQLALCAAFPGFAEKTGRTLWVRRLLEWYRAAGQPMVVVPDVRFLHEASALQGVGAAVWKVNRPGYIGDVHASEAEIDCIEPDEIIPNTGSLEDLEHQVRKLMEYYAE